MDAAYQRLHVVTNNAIRAITILKGLAFIILCLLFGAAAGPTLYSQVSKSICYQTNDLLEDKTWDPDILHSSHYNSFAKSEISKDKEYFGHAKKIAVPVHKDAIYPLQSTLMIM